MTHVLVFACILLSRYHLRNLLYAGTKLKKNTHPSNWWLGCPFATYACQIRSFPQGSGANIICNHHQNRPCCSLPPSHQHFCSFWLRSIEMLLQNLHIQASMMTLPSITWLAHLGEKLQRNFGSVGGWKCCNKGWQKSL